MNDLFVLPFDHRASFAKNLLGFPYPKLSAAQKKQVIAMKQVVFDAFLIARKTVKNPNDLAILIDEEFGAPIIQAAKKQHIQFALSVEKSGQSVFDFEYGTQFGAHLLRSRPTWAKALVRYNTASVKENILQRKRLKILSDFCKKHRLGFILEVLLTKKGARLPQAKQMMQEMQHNGIIPTIWKLEGFEKAADWVRLKKITSSNLIMLGRGESKSQVEKWVKVAAQSGVVNGFAIGRTIFFKPLEDWRDKKIDRAAVVKQIADNYLYFINLWNKYA
ncbi:hypothetical protein A3B21_01320 [Candidatus Uhrbacteria bacterium RIFCSPLOWO2_01_FULL_47_24]|uniref:DUF2090 domain-containing protein n=1 Tax=Candidatus Uhrbacteria bacterium RIFCSPLOWO2_01_FULL_47_24 TaxID=1802401 RepID=A0A1F7UNY1_9BACT|nr:MAG: hypothetical protein A3F52_02985 [Candidatus Uhrbacteria bacterium RIFCSPHIGHO2_12_FULL_47_11]OGL80000.1 MAG: hypothetical protein A3B21_01320 [Candidatus Uhrbacteria bacterium RIFCSPLOWO2_01_FULL_47_24]OGL92105.1 MAG: hypothetical protein A3H11_00795 [Candidatus Uhrbacteria bacterium RIFCSPLOWO2_12_FULL_47_10]